MVFEVFEVLPPPEAIMNIMGNLIREYPGPAVELPLHVAQDHSFVEQLVSFLVHMNVDRLEKPTNAGSEAPETRGTTHPRYITQLLVMILHGMMGKEAQVKRITKCLRDDVCWGNDKAKSPWRRSSLWLVLRVAIQTTTDSRETYKAFMVFFQTQLLQMFLDHNLSSDLLHAARVKTSRRVHKLSMSAPSPDLLQAVEAVSCAINQHLQTRWFEEQRLQAISPFYTPDSTTIEEDTTISLLKSRAYLTKIMRPDSCVHSFTASQTSHLSRLHNVYDFRHFLDDRLTKAIQSEPYLALADFEFVVQERLDGWVAKNSQDDSACETLKSCLEQYISATNSHYSTDPEAKSLMFLTIMELWVALDTIAVIQCPLLSSYSPEIPPSFLHPLLLRRAKSMERASRIELYLLHRHSTATSATSIFSDDVNDTAFAVCYFQNSPALQAVKASIEQAATRRRKAKYSELRDMNAKYRLHSIYSRLGLPNEANSLYIDVHEWPLPNHPLKSQATVFELNCPPVFAIWRACTYQILRDIGMADVKVQSVQCHVLIKYYTSLAKWSKKGPSGRITFGSVSQPHYPKVKIPANRDKVLVQNGLHFQLYDNQNGEFVLSSFNVNLDSYCTLRLPQDGQSLYRHLQSVVAHTTHTHNEILANQGDCPVNLSLHEHIAFSSLRSGSQLQWKNIVRELRTNVLTFSREEVHTLITQAAWQIGPLSSDGSTRQWHFELGVPDFGLVLIREATDLLSRVEANWTERTTVKTISMPRLFH